MQRIRKTLRTLSTYFVALTLFSAFTPLAIQANWRQRPDELAYVSLLSLANFPYTQAKEMHAAFQYEMYFEDVSRSTLFEFMKEIPNDDLWCLCSQTTVVNQGYGPKQIGRQWFQNYTFAGTQDEILYTRLWLQNNYRHSWKGVGLTADITADYKYTDLPNGGVKLTFTAIYKLKVPVTEQQVGGLFEALRQSYETQFIGYFGSEGHVDLDYVEFFYI